MTPIKTAIRDLESNSGQWKAFTTEGHCAVLAPPGSGKTKLLATRFSRDLETRLPRPHGAACITLTNAAANELRRRVSMLTASARSNTFIGTVHGFAYSRVLLPFAEPAGLGHIADRTLLSPAESKAILRECAHRICGDPYEATLVIETVRRNRKLLATSEEWAMSGAAVMDTARLYDAELHDKGVMDFDDVVINAVKLVEHHRFVRKALTACYPQMFVDEYQDLAPGLDRLVKAICFDYRNGSELFAVGDPDQAIYGWTGTRPRLLQELAERGDVTRVDLTINYRSADEIIRRSQLLFSRPRKVVGQRTGGQVSAHYAPSGYDQQIALATTIVRHHCDEGTPLHEILVLCATNDDCARVAAEFRSCGLPCFSRKSDYDATPATQLIEAMAAWATCGKQSSGHRLDDLLWQWRSLVDDLRDGRSEVDAVATLLKHTKQPSSRARQFVEELRSAGLATTLRRSTRDETSYSVSEMLASLRSGTLAGYTTKQLGQRALRTERVEITTMASGKGLEFDIVCILGADEGTIPYYKSKTPDEFAEECRKFYVSLTRAREQVHIFYSGFRTAPRGRRFTDGPSRFLRQLQLS